jgi:hypothetical protein
MAQHRYDRCTMDTNQSLAALTSALTRLTQAADSLDAQITALPARFSAPAQDDADLIKRHDRLRSEVGLVVNELEQMVADRG